MKNRVIDGIELSDEDINITKEDIDYVRGIAQEMTDELEEILEAPETEEEKAMYDDIFDENKTIEEQVKTAYKYKCFDDLPRINFDE